MSIADTLWKLKNSLYHVNKFKERTGILYSEVPLDIKLAGIFFYFRIKSFVQGTCKGKDKMTPNYCSFMNRTLKGVDLTFLRNKDNTLSQRRNDNTCNYVL